MEFWEYRLHTAARTRLRYSAAASSCDEQGSKPVLIWVEVRNSGLLRGGAEIVITGQRVEAEPAA